MTFHLALLWSDWLVYFLLIILIFAAGSMLRRPHFRNRWRHVLESSLGMVAVVILVPYILIALLDSLHLEIPSKQGQQFVSVVDLLLKPLAENQEVSYSAPFSLHSYTRVLTVQPNGQLKMQYERLKFAGKNIQSNEERNKDIQIRIIRGFGLGLLSYAIFLGIGLFINLVWKKYRAKGSTSIKKRKIAWRSLLSTLLLIWLFIAVASQLIFVYHILGTGKVGNDIFYQTVKSIRTGFLIGTLTTLFTLPFALLLGTAAGYFRGWIDDIIQYSYTTLSSIPGVLLISAMVLVLEVYMNKHANWFPTLEQRADARLLALCMILGITSWSTLCRLLRAETLKIRQLEYVQAARGLGVHQLVIILRHVIPNVMHIVIITVVLDFSGLVLAEAVLSYIGVGVDPTMISWGNMINSSRLELAREPTVWWPLLAALTFMFVLVLAANLFADAVRDAFDPRIS